MKKNERIETEMKNELKKRVYAPPTIEAIGEVRDVTRGSTLGNTDSGGQSSNVPSDAGGWN